MCKRKEGKQHSTTLNQKTHAVSGGMCFITTSHCSSHLLVIKKLAFSCNKPPSKNSKCFCKPHASANAPLRSRGGAVLVLGPHIPLASPAAHSHNSCNQHNTSTTPSQLCTGQPLTWPSCPCRHPQQRPCASPRRPWLLPPCCCRLLLPHHHRLPLPPPQPLQAHTPGTLPACLCWAL